MDFPYSRLRRWPDVEADNLQAYDATDLLLVERALELGVPGREIAVIGDEYGAITLALTAAGLDGIRVHQDLATGRRAMERNAEELGLSGHVAHELDASLLAGARLVLLQLPKALAELEEIADAVARWAAQDVTLVAGGRVKHMTLAQNDVLGRSFGTVRAERAERKSRLVVATDAKEVPVERPFPVSETHGGLTLVAHGGAFAGARLDIGTRVLLDALRLDRSARTRVAEVAAPWVAEPVEAPGSEDATTWVAEPVEAPGPDSGTQAPDGALRQAQGPRGEARGSDGSLRQAQGPKSGAQGPKFGAQGPKGEAQGPVTVDLGCGTGALAVSYALAHPDVHVIATDRSAAAVASARATVEANDVADRVTVTHDDAGSEIPDASVDVVLLNPPFHLGNSVHTGAATRLFDAAARILRPGGELFTVYNSSLGYRAELTRLVGPTEQLDRTPKFTVARSIRR